MSIPASNFIQPHRFSVEDYYRMGEAGVFAAETSVELIKGEIVDMPPIGSTHSSLVNRLVSIFSKHLEEQAIVSVQNPVRLSHWSEPQPDLSILKYRDDFYKNAHPTPEDVILIIEVADTSLSYDRDTKLPLYARHGIPECWLIDVQGKAVGINRKPKDGIYQQQMIEDNLNQLQIQGLADRTFDLASLLD